MQRNNSKCKRQNHGHDNEEDIEATVMAGRVEPNEQNSWECKCCNVASNWHRKQSNIPKNMQNIRLEAKIKQWKKVG